MVTKVGTGPGVSVTARMGGVGETVAVSVGAGGWVGVSVGNTRTGCEVPENRQASVYIATTINKKNNLLFVFMGDAQVP